MVRGLVGRQGRHVVGVGGGGAAVLALVGVACTVAALLLPQITLSGVAAGISVVGSLPRGRADFII